MADDGFEERSNVFMAWLKSTGAEISEKIQLADLRGQNAGRGVGKLLFLQCQLERLWLRICRASLCLPQDPNFSLFT